MRSKPMLAYALALLTVLAVGCATPSPADPDSAGGGGMMGGGSGAMASGVIAVSRDASMSAPSYDATAAKVRVMRVLAPADGWVVVRSAAAPGGVLGSARVRAGENADVSIALKAVDGRDVRVALHVDRGVSGELEFDPTRSELALDKPLIVDGAPLEAPVELTGWGVDAVANSALIMTEDQAASSSLVVTYLLVPAPSWIEVRRLERGVPGRRLGVLARSAGESQQVVVPLRGAAPGDELLITVCADRGAPGIFEPATSNALRAVDAPWVSAGVVVASRIVLR